MWCHVTVVPKMGMGKEFYRYVAQLQSWPLFMKTIKPCKEPLCPLFPTLEEFTWCTGVECCATSSFFSQLCKWECSWLVCVSCQAGGLHCSFPTGANIMAIPRSLTTSSSSPFLRDVISDVQKIKKGDVNKISEKIYKPISARPNSAALV